MAEEETKVMKVNAHSNNKLIARYCELIIAVGALLFFGGMLLLIFLYGTGQMEGMSLGMHFAVISFLFLAPVSILLFAGLAYRASNNETARKLPTYCLLQMKEVVDPVTDEVLYRIDLMGRDKSMVVSLDTKLFASGRLPPVGEDFTLFEEGGKYLVYPDNEAMYKTGREGTLSRIGQAS